MRQLIVVVSLMVAGAFAVPVPDESDSRIVGGVTAPRGLYPHQISLRTRDNKHFCGGSIIDANWILTAAHCVRNQYSGNLLVVVGTNSLSNGGVAYAVSDIYIYDYYDPSNNQHDIALLVISGTIRFDHYVQPIALSSQPLAAKVTCILSGWGLTSFPSNQLPNELQHIALTSISYEQCASALPGYPVFPTHVCTYSAPGQGACQGDSGGPLISGNVQVGVVSWGIPCARGAPDMFTSVAHYRNWIRSVSGV